MDAVFDALSKANRKAFWRLKPMWKPHAEVTPADLDGIALSLAVRLPQDLRAFLIRFGFGDLNDELAFRREWLAKVDVGPLAGHLVFAQDDRGNLYTSEPETGAVHYLDRFEPGYCKLASTFTSFLEGSAAHGFEVVSWAESKTLSPYLGAA